MYFLFYRLSHDYICFISGLAGQIIFSFLSGRPDTSTSTSKMTGCDDTADWFSSSNYLVEPFFVEGACG